MPFQWDHLTELQGLPIKLPRELAKETDAINAEIAALLKDRAAADKELARLAGVAEEADAARMWINPNVDRVGREAADQRYVAARSACQHGGVTLRDPLTKREIALRERIVKHLRARSIAINAEYSAAKERHVQACEKAQAINSSPMWRLVRRDATSEELRQLLSDAQRLKRSIEDRLIGLISRRPFPVG